MTQQEVRTSVDRALDALARQLDDGQSDAMRQYLTAMARFRAYSWTNQLLIHAQFPTATKVAGFNAWKGFNRHVRRGERGIAILAPVVPKFQRVEDENGNETTIRLPVRHWRTVYVFDVSQTSGSPLPEPEKAHGDPGPFLGRLEMFIRESLGIRLEYSDKLGGALGRSTNGKIEVLSSLSLAQRFSVLVHETAHEICHWSVPDEVRADRRRVESEAEAVAHIVSTAIGLDVGHSSSDYILLYQGSREVLRTSLTDIQRASSRILDGITRATEAANI